MALLLQLCARRAGEFVLGGLLRLVVRVVYFCLNFIVRHGCSSFVRNYTKYPCHGQRGGRTRSCGEGGPPNEVLFIALVSSLVSCFARLTNQPINQQTN